VNVSGAGSAWNNSGPVNVGYSGSGSLNISDDGQVTTAVFIVGSLRVLQVQSRF
jgi:T5SS/PEP-CTERM-associated repeat protein